MDNLLNNFYNNKINDLINYISSNKNIPLNKCSYKLYKNGQIIDHDGPIIFCLGGMGYKIYIFYITR